MVLIYSIAELNSAFPSGMNAAATWSTRLMKSRGLAMGQEHGGKGVDVQLGPVAGPLGRVPEGGRNWEGFSPDPVLTGVAIGQTIDGIQSAGVVACAKHFIMNEQEHYREAGSGTNFGYSANLDDKTMHELYLWYGHAFRIITCTDFYAGLLQTQFGLAQEL
jgi:beta-glucosidase